MKDLHHPRKRRSKWHIVIGILMRQIQRMAEKQNYDDLDNSYCVIDKENKHHWHNILYPKLKVIIFKVRKKI